ncbi:MAG: DUF424 family protein [archaeon]|jgi:hypothetical protein|nr:DUF424 family protein [archaeon]MDD2477752.1 DUF424 family protein [Candidatus ainarchaeum sp.]MDD3084625.1 DUF424 family protein [Candidatus ainarchaeum sp.]MDD4221329.1 DUF424 family protein [Candidatus ainarchaeum sp.]MDD4662838.1 DUF424 family protein [Candidatus ainarchaeum sp.]
MIGKFHKSPIGNIFAACDKELLGSKIIFDDVEIHINKAFYGVDTITEEELLTNINKADSVNIFGNKICSFLVSKKVITKEQIIIINNISHIQIYKI